MPKDLAPISNEPIIKVVKHEKTSQAEPDDQYEIVTYKTVKDFDGNDVVVEDTRERFSVQYLKAKIAELQAKVDLIEKGVK